MDYNHSRQTTKLTSTEPRISISSLKRKSVSSVKLKINHDRGKSILKKEKQKDSTISDEIIKIEKDSQEPTNINLPIYKELSSEQDYIHAKSYLMTASSLTNISVYDHLVELLKKLLREKPINAVDIFENISQSIKLQHIPIKGEYTELSTQVLKIAQSYSDLLMKIKIEETSADDNEEFEIKKSLRKIDDNGIVNNFKSYLSFIQEYGFELNQEEYYHIYSSLILLAKTRPIENVRFWGKIHGIIKDYIIFEADLKNNAELNDMKDLMFKMNEEEEIPNIYYPLDYKGPRDKLENLDLIQDLLLEPKIKSSEYIPAEDIGKGANKNIYFVCNQLREPWILLPKVTPDQISIAKIIKKPFTGIYATPVISYPPFPGKEINLLRAQIALISTDTLVSPKGYYEISREEIDDNGVSYSLNKVENFQISVETLLNPDLSSWVHHSYRILPQGRCTWLNSQKKSKNSSEIGIDNEKEEIEQQIKEQKSVEEGFNEVDVQEVESVIDFEGPSLLSPLSLDKVINGIYPWSLISSSNLMPQYSICILKSNIWPGSYAICDGINLENVYIGFGVKQSENPYSPQLPSLPENQYSSQKIKDLLDPLPEDDEEYQKILQILKLREERRIQLKEERQLKSEKIKEQRRIQKEFLKYEDENENFESLEGSDIQTEEKIEEIIADVTVNNKHSSPKIISSEMKTDTIGTKYELERNKESLKNVLEKSEEQVESNKITSVHQKKESKTIEIIDSSLERQQSPETEISKPKDLSKEQYSSQDQQVESNKITSVPQKKEAKTIEIIDSSLERQQSPETEISKPKDLSKEQYSSQEQFNSTPDEKFKPVKSSKKTNHSISITPITSEIEIPKSKLEFKVDEKSKQPSFIESSLLPSKSIFEKPADLQTRKLDDVNKQNNESVSQNMPKLKSQSFEVETFKTISNLQNDEDSNIESLSKSSIQDINKSPESVKCTTDTKGSITSYKSTDSHSSQKSSIKVPLSKKSSKDSITTSQKSNKLIQLLSDYDPKEERKKSKTYEKLKQKNIERKKDL